MLDIPQLRFVGRVTLLCFVLYMVFGVIYGIVMGVTLPREFVRQYRSLSVRQKLLYTPLVALLTLMVLALIAAAIALATNYARGIY